MNNWIDWSLRHRGLVVLFALAMLLLGAWQTAKTPVDIFPDLTAPSVTIVTEAQGMAPTDVETLVSLPLESALNGAAQVRRVRSNTKVGLSVITVEFEWGVNPYVARQVVSERLQSVTLPDNAGISAPRMMPASSIMGEILFIAVHSPSVDAMQVKTLSDLVVRRQLLAVSGVAEVMIIGGDSKQFQVVLNPERMTQYQLTINEVSDALEQSNRNTSAGFMLAQGQEYLIQGLGKIERLADIEQVLITQRHGLPIRIVDVAEVRIAPAITRGLGRFNGEPAVIMGIQKQPNVNTLALTEKLDKTLMDIQAQLPKEVMIERHIFRQADFIQTAMQNLTSSFIEGMIFVVLVVFFFLRSWRATLISMMAIPLSLVVAIFAMTWLGLSINTMTLGGMVIALGALVDDAIIVVENIHRRLRENARLSQPRESLSVVLSAVQEVRSSIIFATLIIMLVFLPLLFLSGVEGRLMAPLGFAYLVSLGASLLVALLITPVMSYSLLSGRLTAEEAEPRLNLWLKSRYRNGLDKTIHYWKALLTLSLALLLLSLFALSQAGKAFLPNFNEGTLTIGMATLPGTSLVTSDALAKQVDDILLAQPEVVAFARRTGRAESDPHAMDVSASEIEVTLALQGRDKAALLQRFRDAFAAIPGTQIVIGQPISHRIDHMLSGSRANIAIKIFGPDLSELRRLTRDIKAIAQATSGAVDVTDEQQIDIPFLSVRFHRQALAQYGFSMADASQAVETAFYGREVNRIQEGQTSYALWLTMPASTRASIEAVGALLITSPTGAQVPLSTLASVAYDRAPYSISREQVQRKMVVMANVSGRDLASVVEDIQRQVAAQVKLPTGYRIEYGGQFEQAEAATQQLLLLGLVVIVGVFVLLVLALGSITLASLVMLNLPLALIGGVLGVFLGDGILSVASLIGFITLFGIATRNGVMMISHIQYLQAVEGVTDRRDAVIRGAQERLLPILMTALSAALALIPLSLAAGQPGSEIQAPMALVILWGLISATFLTLWVLPAMVLRFGAITSKED